MHGVLPVLQRWTNRESEAADEADYIKAARCWMSV
jgi:hypothetical protein